MQLTTERPAGTVSSISDQTTSGTSTLTVTLEFADLPDGATIKEVRIRPTLTLPGMTRPTGWMFPGSTLVEAGPPAFDPSFVNNCPDGFLSHNVRWVFPGDVVNEDGRMQISFSVDPSCINHRTTVAEDPHRAFKLISESDQMTGALIGLFSVEADVVPAQRFDVKFSTFIPGDSVAGPPHASCRAAGDLLPQILRFSGDNRTDCDPSPSASSRTRQQLSVVADGSLDDIDGEMVTPEGLVDGTAIPAVGLTKSYARPAFDDALIDASDDDAVLNDCVSLHQKKRASADGMRTTVRRLNDMAVEIQLRGSSDNPLVTPAASIDWNLTLTIDVSEGTPKWALKGTHNSFPAYELFVNGQKIHSHSPGDPPFALSDLLTLFDNPFTDVSVSEAGKLQ